MHCPVRLQNGCQVKFQKLSQGSETLDMTSDRLGEMFEGDVADMCGKISIED